MDRPQYQIPLENASSYRFMRYPLPKGILQELYPGRLIDPNWHFTGDNIPVQYGFQVTRNNLALLSKDAALTQESMNRQLGGINPIFDHASVEPENAVEVVDSSIITENEVGIRGRPGVVVVPSALASTNANYVKGGVDGEIMRANASMSSTKVSNSGYAWRKPVMECYDGNVGVRNTPVTGGGINFVFVMVLLVGLGIILFMMGFRLSPLLKLG